MTIPGKFDEWKPASSLSNATGSRLSSRKILLTGLAIAALAPCFLYGISIYCASSLKIAQAGIIPPPPKPEAINVIELPLPPVAPNNSIDSCSIHINPRRTGCISQKSNLQSGNFLPDGIHVTASVNFTGAPVAPHPASMYSGEQVIIIKADGSTFPNGDHWKCITCGVPKQNKVGSHEAFDYVQAFKDGKRLLAGTNIIQCEHSLSSEECTPDVTHIFSIFWNTSSQNTGTRGSMRELRLHPDQEHIGWSSFVFDPPNFGQFCYIGRLQYNPSPVVGEASTLHARYEVSNVFLLVDFKGKPPIYIEGNEIKINPAGIAIGELRGFSGSGEELTYIGAPVESGNADVFAINLVTGIVRRLTSHPEYVDPVDISPDDNWTVVMDTRGSERQMFLSAMRGIPPIIDMITFAAVCSVRNNGQRRFFQPYLIDRYGDRDTYFGQKLNTAGSGIPGSGAVNDPEWNGAADPKWSPDGNRIVYTQKLTQSPACGGTNPIPCYTSTADGGRVERMMMATLISRESYAPPPVTPFADKVPWGIEYVPGALLPARYSLPEGEYTLKGKRCGSALVKIGSGSVGVTYNKYSDDGISFVSGTEQVSNEVQAIGGNLITWFSDIEQTGKVTSTKKTSKGGFQMSINVFENIFEANGTLATTIGGVSYHQPANGA